MFEQPLSQTFLNDLLNNPQQSGFFSYIAYWTRDEWPRREFMRTLRSFFADDLDGYQDYFFKLRRAYSAYFIKCDLQIWKFPSGSLDPSYVDDLIKTGEFLLNPVALMARLKELNAELTAAAIKHGLLDPHTFNLLGYDPAVPYKQYKFLSGYFNWWVKRHNFGLAIFKTILSEGEFYRHLQRYHLFKDSTLRGLVHGVWTHIIQWWLITMQQQREPFLQHSPEEIYRWLGEQEEIYPSLDLWLNSFEFTFSDKELTQNSTDYTGITIERVNFRSFAQVQAYLLGDEAKSNLFVLHQLIQSKAHIAQPPRSLNFDQSELKNYTYDKKPWLSLILLSKGFYVQIEFYLQQSSPEFASQVSFMCQKIKTHFIDYQKTLERNLTTKVPPYDTIERELSPILENILRENLANLPAFKTLNSVTSDMLRDLALVAKILSQAKPRLIRDDSPAISIAESVLTRLNTLKEYIREHSAALFYIHDSNCNLLLQKRRGLTDFTDYIAMIEHQIKFLTLSEVSRAIQTFRPQPFVVSDQKTIAKQMKLIDWFLIHFLDNKLERNDSTGIRNFIQQQLVAASR